MIVKINSIRLGFARGEGNRSFGSIMMEIDKIENIKIKYSEKKKNLSQLLLIKEEDYGSKLIANKSLAVLDIVYLDALDLRGKTNHLNGSFDYFEFNDAQVSGVSSSFKVNKNSVYSNSLSFCLKSSSFKIKNFHYDDLVKFYYYNLKCLLSYRIPVTESWFVRGVILTGMKPFSHKFFEF